MTRVRILSDTWLDGICYAPDVLLDLAHPLAERLVASGHADAHPDAVAYCMSRGITPLNHGGEPAAVDAENRPKTPRRKAAPKE